MRHRIIDILQESKIIYGDLFKYPTNVPCGYGVKCQHIPAHLRIISYDQ